MGYSKKKKILKKRHINNKTFRLVCKDITISFTESDEGNIIYDHFKMWLEMATNKDEPAEMLIDNNGNLQKKFEGLGYQGLKPEWVSVEPVVTIDVNIEK